MQMIMENEKDILQKNVSRLVKLAGDGTAPSKGFTDSLVASAIHELDRSESHGLFRGAFVNGGLDKIMGAAAAIAVLCGAAVQLVLSGLSWASPALASTLLVTTSINWLSYLGRLML